MMYKIESYKSVGNLYLNSTKEEIESQLGVHSLESNLYTPEYLTGVYNDGITISYKKNLVCYIGIHTSLGSIIHSTFDFSNKNISQIVEYFKGFPGDIFIEDQVSVISDYLGISTYFEDGLKEVAIFLKAYGDDISKGLDKLNLEDSIYKYR